MKKCLLLLALLALPSLAHAQTTWSVGYWFPSGQSFYDATPMPVSAIQWSALTHVDFVGATPTTNGTLHLASNFSTDAPALITAAHAHGVKVLFTVLDLEDGGATADWAGAASSMNLTAFISNIMSVVNTYGFDGVDIDWEQTFLATEMSNLLSGLRTSLGTKILTAADTSVGFCSTPGGSFTTAMIAKIDRLMILTYDLNGTYEPHTWFNSPLFSDGSGAQSVDSDSALAIACSYPMNKVGIGIPFYGYLTTPSNGPYQSFGASPSLTQHGYADLSTTYGVASFTYDPTGHSPWRALTGTSWIQWDNAQSVTDKINYIYTNSMGGWVIWILGADYTSGSSPLLAAVGAALKGFYISAAGAGAQSGTDCNDAKPLTFFNNAANWGTSAGQIGPGITVHLCGTITGTVNTTILSIQGSGSAGNPITILWESGAILQSPQCPDQNSACIDFETNSYVTLDGGANGIIQNTANGTGLAHAAASTAIKGLGDHDVIQNLHISNIYVHSSPSDVTIDDSAASCIYSNGFSNLTIQNNVMHDASWCINLQYGTSISGLDIHGNDISNVDHGIALGGNPGGALSGTVTIHDNKIHGFANWDTTADDYHHDGIHIYGNSSSVASPSIYNNQFYGPSSTCSPSCMTGYVFIEGNSSSPGITGTFAFFNNVATAGAGDTISSGGGMFGLYNGGSTNYFVNNTARGNGSGVALCLAMNVVITGVVFENNIMSNCNQLVQFANITFTTLNHNVYAQAISGNDLECGSTFYSAAQFSAWATCVGEGAASSYQSSDGLNAAAQPQSGSPVINAGANLTSVGITALDSDITGGGRQATGAWTDGAYNSGTSPPAASVALTPNPEAFGNQRLTTTSGAQTITVTNTGNVNSILGAGSPVTLTGTNAADFTITGGTCVAGFTLTMGGGTCTITVTFSPTATGARSALLNVVDDAPASPQQSTLTGTGTQASLRLTPTPENFGSVVVAATSSTFTVTLTNSGTATATLTSGSPVTLSGANAADYAIISGTTCTSGATVAASATCIVHLTFTPSATGARVATLNVADDAPGTPQTASLTGTGTQASLSASPSPVPFGSVAVSTTSTAATVTVTNGGTSTATIGAGTPVTFTGTNSTDFANAAGTSCTAGATVGPGANCIVKVTFTPGGAGARTGIINIASNALGSPLTANLTGTGLSAPALAFLPAPSPFGTQIIGTTSPPQTITLTNSGGSPATLNSGTPVTLTGANAADYALTGGTCVASFVLAASGGSCTILISFTPTGTGARTATLNVTDSAPGSPQTAVINGTGQAAPVANPGSNPGEIPDVIS